jgi:hypothetical protein
LLVPRQARARRQAVRLQSDQIPMKSLMLRAFLMAWFAGLAAEPEADLVSIMLLSLRRHSRHAVDRLLRPEMRAFACSRERRAWRPEVLLRLSPGRLCTITLES